MPKQKQPSREARKSEQREESAAPASPSSNESSQSMREVTMDELRQIVKDTGEPVRLMRIKRRGRVVYDASDSPSSKEGEPKK